MLILQRTSSRYTTDPIHQRQVDWRGDNALSDASEQFPLHTAAFHMQLGARWGGGSKKGGNTLLPIIDNSFQKGAPHLHPATGGTWWEQGTQQGNRPAAGTPQGHLLSSELVTGLWHFPSWASWSHLSTISSTFQARTFHSLPRDGILLWSACHFCSFDGKPQAIF